MICRLARAALVALAAALPQAASSAPRPELRPLTFADLPGWADDDHAAALAVYAKTCLSRGKGPALPEGASLDEACAAARALGRADRNRARIFFETHFTPHLVSPGTGGFFTGYFEPEFAGSLKPTRRHSAPLLARPDPLPSPAPDRAAIEAGAISGRGLELVYLDPVDAFFVHIQGSARIRLDDGRIIRTQFAGRNGHKFTAIGRILVERGELTLEQADMKAIRAWLAAHPDQAAALMRENRSYIFFRKDTGRPSEDGPVGASGVPLTAGRSLAVDAAIWPYGLPVWIDARLPAQGGETEFRRLTVAQDTGAAIKGAARADLFIGTGQAAGDIAGRTKHPGNFVVLLPREAAR